MSYISSCTDFSAAQPNQSELSPATCVELAREARAHARAFRESVRAFEQIDMDKILNSLQTMRAISRGQVCTAP